MTIRYQKAFEAVNSTAPAFNVSVTNTSTANALESSGAREWDGPGSRTIRLVSGQATDYYVQFGTSSVVASTLSMLFLGGTVEIPSPIRPGFTHIAMYSSTDMTVNVTIGYGG